ncbi:MAG TPA: type II secretion system F family protein [Steroidobacteraceae bacterium]|nr:type II secretion system F family protein [Steroidobacteraceae bacterium]HRX89573.1 type II secretion system F family protein [Steroidobacteraceae bacterium]
MLVWSALAALAAMLVVHALGRGARWQAVRHENRLAKLSARDLADLFLFIEPAVLVRWSGAAFVLILLTTWTFSGSILLATMVALLTWAVPGAMVSAMRKQRLRKIAQQLPDGIDALAMALRSGLGLNQSLSVLAEQQPAPLSQEIALVSRGQRLGLTLDETLQRFAHRVPLDEIAMLSATIRIAHESGGTLAESLDRLADTVRRKLALEGKIRALTAQGRIQGIIVALLPLALLAVLLWMQPESMRLLFTSVAGWATLGAIIVLECTGYLLIRRIVRIDV